MSHPLQVMIGAIATRSWWLRLLWNAARCLTLVLLMGLLVGGVDYGLRIQDVGLQWILAGFFWAVLVGGCWRLVLPAIRHRDSEIQVAREVEHCFPDLGQRLSSSIAFLQLPVEAAGAGSAALREAVIESTSREIDDLDLGSCVQSKNTWRAAGIMLSLLLLVGLCFVLDTAATTQAASRLTRPWIHDPWPRWNQLQFVEPPPLRIATGESFRLLVQDINGHLPDKVTLQYQSLDNPGQMEVVVMERDGEIAHHRFSNVRRSFQFRVVGGDDDTMPWNAVRVVNPPIVEDLQLDVHAPAYMQWPSEHVQGSFRALQGSQVTVQGRLDRIAKSVFLVTEQDSRKRRRRLILADGGQDFSWAKNKPGDWIIEQSGRYWFEVEDENGLLGVSQDQWEIRMVTDAPPVVLVESPKRQHRLLSGGFVSLSINARDDFGLHDLKLQYRRSDTTGPSSAMVALWPRGEFERKPGPTGFLGTEPLPDQQVITYRWELGSLADLSTTKWIEYRVLATDTKGQVTESAAGRLNLISRSELDQEIMQQQAHIVARLAESLAWQRDARKHALKIQLQFQDQGTYTKSDLDHMQSVELNQRQVRQILANPAEGIPVDVDRLLAMLKQNRVQLPEVSRQLEELLQTLSQIDDQQLGSIESHLLLVLKIGRSNREIALKEVPREGVEGFQTPLDPAIRGAFQQAIQGQHEVVRRLQRLLGEISQQEDYRRFTHDVRRIANLQQQYLEQTERLQVDRLGRTAAQLTSKEKTQQRHWGERQIELSRQLEDVLDRMRKMQERLREKDPASATILSDTLTVAQEEALTGRMRESSGEIQRNQLGQAVRTQSEVYAGLQAMLMILGNRYEHRLDRILRQLQKAALQLERLRVKQDTIGRQLEEVKNEPAARLRQKAMTEAGENQQRFGRELESLLQALRPMGVPKAVEAIQAAAEQMRLTEQAIRQDQSEQALAGSQSATRKLTDAQRQLEQDMFQLKRGLLQQQLERLQEQLMAWRKSQEEIVRETRELDALRVVHPQRKLTRVQRGVLKALAERQHLLAAEGQEAARLLEQSEAFRFGLRVAAQSMSRAADALDQELTDAQTVQVIQLEVLDQLKRLLEALQEKSQTGTTEAENPQEVATGPLPGAASPRSLAELILLELMQRDVNRKTETLHQARLKKGEWTRQQQEQYTELARQQGELAGIVDRLKRTVVPATEESQDKSNTP